MTTTPRADRRARVAAALLGAAAAAGCALTRGGAPPAPLLGPERATAIANAYGGGSLEYRNGNWNAAAEAYQRAFGLNTKDDLAAYLAAASWARAENAPAALEALGEVWRLDSCLQPVPKTFASLAADPRYRDAVAVLKAQGPKAHASAVAFTLADPALYPGALAWDPAARVYYVGDVRSRRILRVAPPAAPGGAASAAELAPAGGPALDAVHGLAVDAPRKLLWAVTSPDPEMEGFRAEDFGRTALVAYDLATGREARRLAPPGRPPHFLSAVAVDGGGTVFAPDGATGELFVLRPGAAQLEVLSAARTFMAAKAVAVPADGRHVFVSDAARGIFRVDPATGEAAALDQPRGTWHAGLDALVLHRGTLVGIAGTTSFGRVARWRLAASGAAADSAEVLDCANPAFRVPGPGTVAGDALVYVANGGARAGGEAAPPGDLVFLTLSLR